MKDSNAMQETFNSVDPANPETFSLLLLPDAASLLRVHFWACFTLEVCGKLGLVGEGNICPPRSGEVAIKALGGSCQVNSSKEVFAYRPCVLQKIFIADIPRAQRAPVKSVTQLKWNNNPRQKVLSALTQKSWSEVKLKPGTHCFLAAGSFW